MLLQLRIYLVFLCELNQGIDNYLRRVITHWHFQGFYQLLIASSNYNTYACLIKITKDARTMAGACYQRKTVFVKMTIDFHCQIKSSTN